MTDAAQEILDTLGDATQEALVNRCAELVRENQLVDMLVAIGCRALGEIAPHLTNEQVSILLDAMREDLNNEIA